MPHTWAEIPQAGQSTQSYCAQRMEDVAFGGTLASLEDEIAPSCTWTWPLEAYDVTL
jgi:hypothetical protein